MNPIEAMARSLFASSCALDPIEPVEPDWGRGGYKTQVMYWHGLARAALTALSENITPEMVEAGAREVDYYVDSLGRGSAESDKTARFVIRAVLAAAMKEQGR